MGIPTTRVLTLLSFILALPAQAQGDASAAQYKVNYGRFTRGDDTKVVDDAMGRMDWFRQRMGGDLGSDFTKHLLAEAEKERAKYPARFQTAGGPDMPVALNGTNWVSLGPTTSAFTQNGGLTLTKVDSGRLRVILPDTADATGNTIYVLASGGGLWKTTNFLSPAPTWTPLTDFIGSNLSGSAAFGRVTSTLFVGAGDPFDLGIGGFMVKSTNGGSTWSAAAQLGTASKIYDLKVDTSQATDIVLAGTDTGLYRSANAGTSYAAVATIPANAKVWSLAKTSAGWLAAVTISTTVGTTTTTAGSLYLSTDQGATWTAVTATAFNTAGRITLGQGLPGDAVVFAFAANTNNATQLDLIRSGDGGATWTALNITGKAPTNPNADNSTMDLMADQAFYNHMILVDPSDASRNTIYLGGQLACAKSTNGGTTWTLLSNWLAQYSLPYIHADFHCAAYANFGGTPRLYFGTDGGIFTSGDGGATWDDTKNKGLVNHLVYSLAANPGVPGSALVGLQDNGTRIRSGQTSTFNQVRGGDGFGVSWAQDVVTPSAVSMSSYVYNSIQRSTTSPVVDRSNWAAFTTGLGATGSGDNGANYYFVTPIVTPPAGVDPSGQVFFTYSSTGKIFQSDATGWTAIGTAGSGGIPTGRFVRAVSHGIGVSPTDLQHIAAAGNGGNLLLTANGGATWTEVFLGAAPPATGGLVAGWVGFNSSIAWANNNLLYVCSEAPTAGVVRVAKSTNGGGTWAAANGNLPDVPVTKLVVDPGDATGNTVYAATWLGVYRTTDGGATWSVFGTGLPQGRVTDIWIAPNSSSMRVSTWGRGVWEMTVPTTVSILAQPVSVSTVEGHTATFHVSASGSGTLAYQWKKNGTIIVGATQATYTTPALALSDSGAAFTCDVTGDLGTVASNAAIVTVQALGPAVTASNTTATSIPDATSATTPGAAVEIPFVVSNMNGIIGEVTFSLYLTHTYVGDLVVTLVAPDNSTVILTNGAGSSGTGGSPTGAAFGTACGTYLVFSDTGASSISTQISPPAIVGTFQPSSPLAAFNSKSANGTWKLRIQDFGPQDVGTFNCGVLSVKPLAGVSLDVNGDGTVDLRDLLTFSKFYGTTTATCDLNGDGTVNDADLTILLAGL